MGITSININKPHSIQRHSEASLLSTYTNPFHILNCIIMRAFLLWSCHLLQWRSSFHHTTSYTISYRLIHVCAAARKSAVCAKMFANASTIEEYLLYTCTHIARKRGNLLWIFGALLRIGSSQKRTILRIYGYVYTRHLLWRVRHLFTKIDSRHWQCPSHRHNTCFMIMNIVKIKTNKMNKKHKYITYKLIGRLYGFYTVCDCFACKKLVGQWTRLAMYLSHFHSKCFGIV